MTYHMKLLKADDIIRDYQGGRNIFRRPSMFSMVVEVERLRDIVSKRDAQLAEAQAEVDRLTVQLEEAGKALSGLGYTPSADDSGSYDSLIPDKYL